MNLWRAFFMAIGISLCILGAECMLIEKAVVSTPAAAAEPTIATGDIGTPTLKSREVRPPDWAPWSLISAGVVVVLYAHTLRRNG